MTILDTGEDRLSLAQKIAMLPPELREQAMAGLDPEQLLENWRFWRRPAQTPPPGNWSTWLMMAGRGCIAAETKIDLANGGTIRVDDACAGGESLIVLALHDDGRVRPTVAETPFLKGIEELWEIRTEDDRIIAVTMGHRFLTPQGWRPLSSLRVGQPLAVAPPVPQEKVWSSRPALRPDGQHCRGIVEGFRCGCPTCRRSHDRPPRQVPDTGRDAAPSSIDADGHIPLSCGTDVRSLSPGCSRPYRRQTPLPRSSSDPDGLSREDVRYQPRPFVPESPPVESQEHRPYLGPIALDHGMPGFDPMGHRTAASTARDESERWRSSTSREASPRLLADDVPWSEEKPRSILRGRSAATLLRTGPESPRWAEWTPIAGQPGFLSLLGDGSQFDEIYRSVSQSLAPTVLGCRVLPTPRSADRVSFDPIPSLDNTEHIRWTRIVSVTRRGVEPYYDLHVPGLENYSAEGILHHNSGKTRSASEWIHERVADGFAKRILLLGRTAADVRDVMLHGESGLLNTGPSSQRPEYSPSKRLVTWPNGAEALCLSADEPDQARGPQADTAWADEFASFPGITGADGATAFDNLRMGLRLPVDGDVPRMILTTTPRRTPAMFKLLEEANDPKFGIVITRGTTYENLGNLADSFRNTIIGLYEGTRLGRQELLGEMLTDIEGALFLQEWFDEYRVDELPPGRMYGVVGVDPSVAERPNDECGIVVMKATMERDFYRRHLYVVEDATVKGSPSVWAKRVAYMARKWDAPIVAEGNQGGELVRMAIAQADSNLPVHIVHAKAGKATRAEPVAALAESGRLHAVGWHAGLEDQACNWIPSESRQSPDRLDALVWAALSLSTRQKGVSFALGRHLRARSSRGRLPQISAATMSMKSRRR